MIARVGEEKGAHGQITENAETVKPPCTTDVTTGDTLCICPNLNTRSEPETVGSEQSRHVSLGPSSVINVLFQRGR